MHCIKIPLSNDRQNLTICISSVIFVDVGHFEWNVISEDDVIILEPDWFSIKSWKKVICWRIYLFFIFII